MYIHYKISSLQHTIERKAALFLSQQRAACAAGQRAARGPDLSPVRVACQMRCSHVYRGTRTSYSAGGLRPTRIINRAGRMIAKCSAAKPLEKPNQQPAVLRIHYVRKDGNYKGWQVHVWGDAALEGGAQATTLAAASGTGAGGAPYWDVPLRPAAAWVGAAMKRGDETGAVAERIDVQAAPTAAGAGAASPAPFQEVWLAGNERNSARAAAPAVADLPAGDLSKAHAHWVDRGTVAWRFPAADAAGGAPRAFELHFSATASLHVTADGLEGADLVLPLTLAAAGGPPRGALDRFPFLAGCTWLELPRGVAGDEARVRELLRHGQVAAVARDGASGAALDACGVQLHGALDDVCATDEPLGVTWDAGRSGGGGFKISVWAPTARSVELLHYGPAPRGGGAPAEHAMARGARGVWSLDAPAEWEGTYYTYRVTAFCPWTNQIEVSEATDPYSRALAADGACSVVFDLSAPTPAAAALEPPGWREPSSAAAARRPLDHWADISVYELHVRDFSASDATVPAALRGKYGAFVPAAIAAATAAAADDQTGSSSSSTSTSSSSDDEQSNDAAAAAAAAPLPTAGLRHLAALADAGLTHVHLLPTFDFGSVPERAEDQLTPNLPPRDDDSLAPDSEAPQAAIAAVCDADAYNWGYDPVHYGVPEGSYSTQPDGPQRTLEYRQMVSALHALGLRVVVDVVYNHTFASGPRARYSVLDKVVPGYYHRRLESGEMCHSTCCNNTASENAMMGRLMVDDVTHWATAYKVDGFRFDIMGHHLVRNMAAIRAGLDALEPGRGGVDGRAVYLYGEAWDFGEVALNARGLNASQLNIGGTRIGAFNDRMRDGAMGGSPFEPPDAQGFVTGLAVDDNGAPHQGTPAQQLAALLERTLWVRSALAGNLREMELVTAAGEAVLGRRARYHATQPLAYGVHPEENVVYCGCHDNETIFDQVTMKAPAAAPAEARARMCRLALALVLLSQGVPFIHAGDDLLRSKSLDRDSYNSGDHFNRIDWAGSDNNFGVGLPPASKNQHSWPFKRPLLAAERAYKPTPALIRGASEYVQALLRVRYSTPLLRLREAAHVKAQLAFDNVGPGQVPGVIVMRVASADRAGGSGGGSGGVVDEKWGGIVVVFNARPAPHAAPYPPGAAALALHPELAALATRGDAAMAECCADDSAKTLTVAARTAAVFVEPCS